MMGMYSDIDEEASSKHGMDMKLFRFHIIFFGSAPRNLAMQYRSTMCQTHELNQPKAGRNDYIVSDVQCFI